MHSSLEALPRDVLTAIDQQLDLFESAWKTKGHEPRIDDFISEELPNPLLKMELIQMDMEIRLRKKQSVGVEKYLTEYPELGLSARVLKLILCEFRCRVASGTPPTAAELRERFPQLMDELTGSTLSVEMSRLLVENDQFHRLIGAAGHDDNSPATTVALRNEGTGTKRPSDSVDDQWPAIPGFEILELISQGGMGRVYRARQLNPARVIALKVIRAELAPGEEALLRFQTEVNLAAKLDHPGIVRVFEAGQYGTLPYFSMQLVDGEDLGTLLRRDSPDAKRIAELVRDIAEALEHAHSNGVLHRDLKPSNVLLSRDGKPLVADFGLAKHLDGQEQDLSATGQPIGTFAYMSPEQANGAKDQISVRTDVYGLGTILYEALTGRMPFRGTNVEIFKQVVHGDVTLPRLFNRRVDRELEAICMKCLERLPHHRYASAHELAEELGRFLRQVPIRARPIGPTRRAWKWSRRHPALAATTVVACLATISIIGVTLIYDGRLRATNKELSATNEKVEQKSLQLTKANQTLEQKQDQLAASNTNLKKRETEVWNLVADQTKHQGDWVKLLDSIDTALTHLSERSDPTVAREIELRLSRIEALNALQQSEAARKEVQALMQRTDLAAFRPRVQLWHGDLLLATGQTEQAVQLIKKALQSDLPLAERHYAEAIVSTGTLEAIEHLKQAITADPLHQRSRQHLIAALIWLGRREEAMKQTEFYRELFPQDSTGHLLEWWIHTFAGNESGVQRSIEQLKQLQQYDESTLAAMTELPKQIQVANNWIAHWEEGRLSLVPLVKNVGKAYIQFKSTQGSKEASFSVPTPPCIEQAYGKLVPSSLGDLLRFAAGDMSTLAGNLTEAARHHPDGLLHFIRGIAYFNAQKFQEAEEAFQLASSTPAILPSIRPEALFVLAMMQAERGLKDESEFQHAARNAALRHASGYPLRETHAIYLTRIAIRASDTLLARKIIADQLAKSPDNPKFLAELSRCELADNHPLAAMHAADRALKIEAGSAYAQKHYDQARQALKPWLRSPTLQRLIGELDTNNKTKVKQ